MAVGLGLVVLSCLFAREFFWETERPLIDWVYDSAKSYMGEYSHNLQKIYVDEIDPAADGSPQPKDWASLWC